MLQIVGGNDSRNRIDMNRREMMRLGAFGSVGLTLPQLLQASAADREQKSCILVFANGGPAQLDTFDPKPDAPEQIRGEFHSIETTAPGMRICEHLPKLARLANEFSLIRTVSHNDSLHTSATYYALTGHKPPKMTLDMNPSPQDMPSIGSVLAKLRPAKRTLPSYVIEPQLCYDAGRTQTGQYAGFLGTPADPLVAVGDPNSEKYEVQGLKLNASIGLPRMESRRKILDSLDRQLDFLGESVDGKSVDYYHTKAYELLSSNEAKAAFDLTAESDATRARYGRNRYGQSYLLARRLVESGVRMVMVNDNIGTNNDRWDTHSGNFGPLRKHLPQADAGLSSLIEDLRQRGLLDTTLVIWMGEMGRTPTGGHTGHWPQCYSVLMAGGGIKGGRIYGRSDKHASYPAADGCSPGDVIATVYHALGIPAHTTLLDLDNRPIHLYNGKPISQLL